MAHVGVQGCRVRKGPRMCLVRGRVDSGIFMSFRSTKFLSCLHNKAVCRQLPPGEKSELCSSFPPRPGGKDRQSLAGSRALKKSSTSTSRCGGASSDGQTALEKIAVVIVDHGSRRKESNDQLERFVELYRNSNPREFVLAAHMEIATPSILDAVKKCSQEGCSKVVIAPYFLSQGRHIQQDIPALVEEACSAHPQLECVVADPIGLDVTVVDIIKSRVDAALE